MGPTILFDKSFLQSLSLDESVWFDHFFFPVVSPLFYVETLADLEKAVRNGRTPEEEVGLIADKTPERHGGPCIHHRTLCLENLMGRQVPMDGRIPVAGGRPVRSEGQKGVVYELSPEAAAFARWRDRDFLELERQIAREWRSSLNNLDLNAVTAAKQAMGIDATCKSLEQAKELAEIIVKSKGKPDDRMQLALLFLGIPSQHHQPILDRWRNFGSPDLSSYAPYAAYVLTVEVFFQLGLNSGFISPERASNRVDIAYLFYLPFSMVFVSTDKLHRRCAPAFLRPDQEFVWGADLKADLTRLNQHYLNLPESEREVGIDRFASTPPKTEGYLVSQLWDRHLRPWRHRPEASSATHPENAQSVVDRLKRFSDAPTDESADFSPEEVEVMSIQRKVRIRKGSWWQLPKGFGSSQS